MLEAGVWASISTLIALIGLVVKAWLETRPAEKVRADKEKRDAITEEYIQRMREKLLANDSPAVDALAADQHDRVQRLLGGAREGAPDSGGGRGDGDSTKGDD